jgi:hypothetical protein
LENIMTNNNLSRVSSLFDYRLQNTTCGVRKNFRP